MRIEDYALIGDTRTAALVGKDGSIDWLCLPRFDSGACFASLVGRREHGHWQLAPIEPVTSVRRAYRPETLVLETELTTASGVVRIIDCMPPDEPAPNVVRIVEGVAGTCAMRMELIVRFDYGSITPWVRRVDDGTHYIGGPDALILRASVPVHGEGLTTVSDFTVRAGERARFVLSWHASHEPRPRALDADAEVGEAERWWRAWCARCTYDGPYRDAVLRSALTLKALTYTPTGAIIAAPTTSLPEHIGGVRNWDYRYSWLRDATFTLYALLLTGFREEACAWRDWLMRAVAGESSKLQIMYGVGGERRLPELELPWLPGYEGSLPVRIGNGAVNQLQHDVYGEVTDALFHARRLGLPFDPWMWRLERRLLTFLEDDWREPDEGIWEVRGPRRHFVHSKMMAWVAFDRAVKAVERFGLDGPAAHWRSVRDAIHAEVCARGFNATKRAFVQSYDSDALDASLLVMPLVGFLPARDPRVASTVAAIERELVQDGLVLRYRTDAANPDGLPGHEGTFLLCSFWLADNLTLLGRTDEARALFERLLSLRNDVGLLAEEYDPRAGRMLGNFPQAFSHVGLINTALNLASPLPHPAEERERS